MSIRKINDEYLPNRYMKGNDMLGYGIGFIGQGTSYCFMSTYLVLFLTNCAGFSATKAGAVSAIALLVEVFVGMIVGNASDKCTSRYGRRIPFLATAGIGIIPIMVLLFKTWELSGTVAFVYYLFLAIMFRVCFSFFEIPNQALGAEIVSGYDGRTRLRTMTRYFSICGNGFAYILPLFILEMYDENASAGWWVSGTIIGVITAVTWIISAVTNRGKGVVLEKEAKTDEKKPRTGMGDILKNYLELFNLKTGKLMVVYKAAFTCAYALFNVSTIYYLTYSVGLNERVTSYMFIITIAMFLVFTPVISKLALRFGKVRQQLVAFTLGGAIGLAVFLAGPETIPGAAIYIAFAALMQSGFWQISPAIFYDVIEVDEWVNHKRREGDLMSMISVLGTLISAIMIQGFGIAADVMGFDPALAVQPGSFITFLNVGFILIPSLCAFAGAIVLFVFPINKKTFESLQKALAARSKGLDTSEFMDDVKKITGEK